MMKKQQLPTQNETSGVAVATCLPREGNTTCKAMTGAQTTCLAATLWSGREAWA